MADEAGWDYERLVGSLYEAAIDPRLWDEALADFTRFANTAGDGHAERLALVMPHMVRAVRLFQMREQLQQCAVLRTGALDRIALPILVLGTDGHLLLSNAAGHELAASPFWPAIGERLSDVPQEGGWVRMPAMPEGDTMLFVTVPLFSGHGCDGVSARFVMVSGHRADDTCLSELLRDMFSLTPAEIRVALAVAEGHSVADVATVHRIQPETVRGQLKDAFAKLGVRRQAELARFVGSVGTIVPHGGGVAPA